MPAGAVRLCVTQCGFNLTVTFLSRVALISNGASPMRSPTLTTTTYFPSPSSSDGDAVLSVVIGTRFPSLLFATSSMVQTAPFFHRLAVGIDGGERRFT